MVQANIIIGMELYIGMLEGRNMRKKIFIGIGACVVIAAIVLLWQAVANVEEKAGDISSSIPPSSTNDVGLGSVVDSSTPPSSDVTDPDESGSQSPGDGTSPPDASNQAGGEDGTGGDSSGVNTEDPITQPVDDGDSNTENPDLGDIPSANEVDNEDTINWPNILIDCVCGLDGGAYDALLSPELREYLNSHSSEAPYSDLKGNTTLKDVSSSEGSFSFGAKSGTRYTFEYEVVDGLATSITWVQ